MRESDFFRQKKNCAGRRRRGQKEGAGRHAISEEGKKFSIAYPRVSSYVLSDPVVEVESCSCSTKPEVQTHRLLIFDHIITCINPMRCQHFYWPMSHCLLSPPSSLGLSICKYSLVFLLWAIYFRIGCRRVFLSHKPATLYEHAVTSDRKLLSVGFPRIMNFFSFIRNGALCSTLRPSLPWDSSFKGWETSFCVIRLLFISQMDAANWTQ